MALAMLSVFGAARADQEAVRELTEPSSAVSVGAGAVSGDPGERSLFGQYNGLRRDDAYFLLDFLFNRRDAATGTWLVLEGRDLGLETRELRGLFGRQGNWRLFGEYSEIVRRDPRSASRAMGMPATV